MNNKQQPIIVEQSFKASIRRVWHAITEADEMRQWFFENIESFKPETGFETQFNVKTPDRDFLHLWKLTEVIPFKRIIYNWKYGDYPGDALVTFELFERDNGTSLRLTNEVTAPFPEDIPEFSRESCIEGWNYFIKDRLAAFLEKKMK